MASEAIARPEVDKPIRPADLSGAVRTAFNILDKWQVSAAQAQAILGLPKRTYFAWRKRAPKNPDRDKLERVSYVLGIWKNLQMIFPDPDAYCTWPKRPNEAPLFRGRAPIELMASGRVADLYRVHALVYGWRG
jgi:uncharacterized protein (DUF2384 family)